MDIKKLKKRISECGYTLNQVAERLDMNPSTLYRRMESTGESFTVREISVMTDFLNLDGLAVLDIFFTV